LSNGEENGFRQGFLYGSEFSPLKPLSFHERESDQAINFLADKVNDYSTP